MTKPALYDFNQRVHLRVDPAQFGRIGRGPYGELAAKDRFGFYQFVFWDHKGADIVTCEKITDLMDEAEYHERRRLFYAAMRHPEMRWVREAFKHLRDDQGIDWRAIKEMELDPPMEPFSSVWSMNTDKFVTVLIDAVRYDGIEDFMTVPHHDDQNPFCECYYCYDATMDKRETELRERLSH